MQFKHRDFAMGGTTLLRNGEPYKPILVPTGGTPKVSTQAQQKTIFDITAGRPKLEATVPMQE